MGKCDGDPSILTGEVQDEASWEAEVIKENSPIATQNLFYMRVLFEFEFGSTDRMLQDLPKLEREVGAIRGVFRQTENNWLCGMVYFRLYKLRGKRQFKRRALAYFRAVKKWSLDGVENCTLFYYLLDAERLSLSDMVPAKAAYEKAIACSIQRKMHLFQALASECAGMAFLRCDTAIACDYLVSARDLWEQLSGAAKVEYIELKLSLIPDLPYESSSKSEGRQPAVVWINPG